MGRDALLLPRQAANASFHSTSLACAGSNRRCRYPAVCSFDLAGVRGHGE